MKKQFVLTGLGLSGILVGVLIVGLAAGFDDLHKRFRDGEVDIFKKNGMEVLGAWQSLDDPNTLVYLLAHKDRAARDASWAAFQADPKWIELRTKYPVTLNPKIFMMSAADYSPLK